MSKSLTKITLKVLLHVSLFFIGFSFSKLFLKDDVPKPLYENIYFTETVKRTA